ncbi:MAG: agmatinase [Spirochaetes bacterium]|nr:MAG: agmatinase [Spirochaetota bacterium]RKY03984.1 MAG: agmatinase [Spirochaetota bacterium]
MNNSTPLKFLEATGTPEADSWLIGIPFDGTASFKPGARFAPDAIRHASQGLESYSPYLNADLSDFKIYDSGNMDISFSSPEKTMDEIYNFYKEVLSRGKLVCTLGGEHSITFPIVKALVERYPELKLIHLDAHADMRESYGGSKYSHASVIKRILEVIDVNNYYGFGIRSGLRDSFNSLKKLKNFYPFNDGINRLKEISAMIDNSIPVYITFDLDVLDPSFIPGTGAPEPAGVSTKELLQAILKLSKLNIVGFDIVELCPPCDPSGISETTAAFFTRELLLIMNEKTTQA